MTGHASIRYLGWSTILLESASGDIAFDPFFRRAAGATYANLEDFARVTIICLTHGHSDHFLDAHKVAAAYKARIVSSRTVCDRMQRQFGIDSALLVPVEPHRPVVVDGMQITAFPWYHRRVNYMRFLRGDFFTGVRFMLMNLFLCPMGGPYYGFLLQTPEGLRLMNLTEGVNSNLPTDAVEALARSFKPTVLIAGMQLTYDADMARTVKAVSPRSLILYHPHEALFRRMRLESLPPERFVASIREAAPHVKIFTPGVGDRIDLPVK